jgi:hypothetical protein
MHPSPAFPDPGHQRTPSYIVGLLEPMWGFPDNSFIVFEPCRRKPRRRRSPAPPSTRRRVDPWQPMAGRLELVADVARQAARAARDRDPKEFDQLMHTVRVALLEAIGVYNTDPALQ